MKTKELIAKFKEQNTDKDVVSYWDFDLKHLVIEAIPKDGDLSDLMDIQTLFGIEKDTGKITAFAQTPDNMNELFKKHRQIL